MVEENDFHFSKKDFEAYQNWLGLNLDAVTWQGRYTEEFQEFWSIFFLEGQSFKQITDRFRFAIIHSKIGPLISWFTWLRNRLMAFTYIEKNISILTLSQEFDLPLGDTALIIRDYFLEANPFLVEELSKNFQIAHISDENINLKFQELQLLMPSSLKKNVDTIDDVMTSMEVTLYPEWRELAEKTKKTLYHPQFDFTKIKSHINLKSQIRIFRDFLLMAIVGMTLIFLVKQANRYWEESLFDRISIYEPQLKWLNKTLTFKSVEKNKKENFKLRPETLENVENVEDKFKAPLAEDKVRYDVESEVILTSWDNLPRDFDVAELEQSEYEELKKRSYRDSRYGNTKVYRVLMRSEDTLQSKEDLNKLLERYQVTRVDNVKPGQKVPGGAYYNIYIPREYLKEFMAQVMDLGDAVLYESRTSAGHNPPGKNKVFIWIKSI